MYEHCISNCWKLFTQYSWFKPNRLKLFNFDKREKKHGCSKTKLIAVLKHNKTALEWRATLFSLCVICVPSAVTVDTFGNPTKDISEQI